MHEILKDIQLTSDIPDLELLYLVCPDVIADVLSIHVLDILPMLILCQELRSILYCIR